MQGHRLGSGARWMLLVTATAALAGGQGHADAGPGHGSPGAPIALEYACGNSFAVINSTPEPVTATYRVAGADEEGAVRVKAAPEEDPHFSEALIETRHRGTVELFRDGVLVDSRVNDGLPCAPAPSQSARAAVADEVAVASETAGAWEAAFSWPIVAVHMHLLPNGRVLAFGRDGNPQVWDPAARTFTAKPSSDNLFCSGHSFLSDGRLFVAGGHIARETGLPDLNTYSTSVGYVALTQPMRQGRWYPTATTMANGEVVILAGRVNLDVDVPIPEVWTAGSLRELTNASRVLPMYPRAFLAPNGRLFYAGEAATSLYLNIAGSGSWSTVGNRRTANRLNGAAVMYQPGRILYAGGGRTTNTAEIINLNASTPAWTFTRPMAFARQSLNLVMLPTGEVLATSGTNGAGFNDLTRAVLAAEIWSPTTGTWRTVASAARPRGYHSTAVLLADGRVLLAGGGDYSNAVPDQLSGEIYSPPYLFKGARPTITSAPASTSYGSTFRVTTPGASAIAQVSLIRLGSTTHSFDMNQRYQTLAFTRDATGLTVTAPASRNVTPPGHYMLFILNTAGVPSVARIVRVN